MYYVHTYILQATETLLGTSEVMEQVGESRKISIPSSTDSSLNQEVVISVSHSHKYTNLF